MTSPARPRHGDLVLDPPSGAPLTVSGVKRRRAPSIPAPIAASGSTTRSTGRRRIDSSPSRVQTFPGWLASHPGSSLRSVPELPTSSRPPVASSGSCRPTPRTTTRPFSCFTPAPRLRSAFRAARVSAESR